MYVIRALPFKWQGQGGEWVPGLPYEEVDVEGRAIRRSGIQEGLCCPLDRGLRDNWVPGGSHIG